MLNEITLRHVFGNNLPKVMAQVLVNQQRVQGLADKLTLLSGIHT